MVGAGAVKRPYWYVLAGRGCGRYVGDVLESLYQCNWTFPASVGGPGSLYGSYWTVVASVGGLGFAVRVRLDGCGERGPAGFAVRVQLDGCGERVRVGSLYESYWTVVASVGRRAGFAVRVQLDVSGGPGRGRGVRRSEERRVG